LYGSLFYAEAEILKPAIHVTTCALITVLILISQPLHAQYLDEGAEVCTAPSAQFVEDITSDGASGAVFVWEDGRNTWLNIYAQRLDAWGYPQWTDGGVAVYSDTVQQQYPRVISDGAGGAIITWSDTRSGSYVVYGQRIDATGAILWNTDGNPLSTGNGWQRFSVPVPDGAGGAIVLWESGIGAATDIYAQRIDGAGATQWAGAGNAVCTASGEQASIDAIAGGGVIAVWNDRRSGDGDIYAQRFDITGTALWTADGVAVCSGADEQAHGGIADDGAGGAIIAWIDYRSGVSYDIYAQRIDSFGVAQWAADGVLVPSRSGDAGDLHVAPDGGGGFLYSWVSNDTLFAGRVDQNGSPLWTTPLANGGIVSISNLIPDAAGGAVIAWETAGDIYGQRIDAGGDVVWSAGGEALCTAADNQRFPVAAPDGTGGLIAGWWDYRNSGGNPFEGDVYAARITGDGTYTATLLESHSAFIDESDIVLEWTLAAAEEGITFTIRRAEAPETAFESITGCVIERAGRSFRFRDAGCRAGGRYRYRVEIEDDEGVRTLFETEILTVPAAGPLLLQNHPNPFNPSTEIGYRIVEDGPVTLDIFDIEGRLIVRLVDGYRTRGSHTVRWNGTGADGRSVGSGLYLYRLTTGKHRLSRKMAIMR
jgi:hypothetical protein